MPPLGNGAGGGPPMSPPLSIIQSADISISHSNASTSATYNSGAASSPNYATNGVGVDGSGNLTLTGNWSTIAPLNGLIHKVKVNTNFVAADLTTAGNANILFEMKQAYLISSGSSSMGARAAGNIANGTALTTGPSYSGDIGDIGTYVFDVLPGTIYLAQFGHPAKVIGANYTTGWPLNIASNGYWAWWMQIHADYPTKTYKFRFDLEYY